MWTGLARAGIALPALTFLMWVLVQILDGILGVATTGPHADAESVERVGGYFQLMTVDNLVLLAGLAVGIYLLGRAAVERRLAR